MDNYQQNSDVFRCPDDVWNIVSKTKLVLTYLAVFGGTMFWTSKNTCG
nr:MAG TPA: hypothetical protein [Caudoviricetes sp.]